MQTEQDKRIDRFYDQIKDLIIHRVNDDKTHYELRKPDGSSNCMVLIDELPYKRIVIGGDFHPGSNGVVSRHGYDLNWFCNASSSDYLAEKFAIENRWTRERLMDEANEKLANSEKKLSKDEEAFWLEAKNGYFDNEYELLDALMNTYNFYDSDYTPGYGYDPRDIAILAAIQRRFSELRKEAI